MRWTMVDGGRRIPWHYIKPFKNSVDFPPPPPRALDRFTTDWPRIVFTLERPPCTVTKGRKIQRVRGKKNRNKKKKTVGEGAKAVDFVNKPAAPSGIFFPVYTFCYYLTTPWSAGVSRLCVGSISKRGPLKKKNSKGKGSRVDGGGRHFRMTRVKRYGTRPREPFWNRAEKEKKNAKETRVQTSERKTTCGECLFYRTLNIIIVLYYVPATRLTIASDFHTRTEIARHTYRNVWTSRVQWYIGKENAVTGETRSPPGHCDIVICARYWIVEVISSPPPSRAMRHVVA